MGTTFSRGSCEREYANDGWRYSPALASAVALADVFWHAAAARESGVCGRRGGGRAGLGRAGALARCASGLRQQDTRVSPRCFSSMSINSTERV
jgi:hypothetical protein